MQNPHKALRKPSFTPGRAPCNTKTRTKPTSNPVKPRPRAVRRPCNPETPEPQPSTDSAFLLRPPKNLRNLTSPDLKLKNVQETSKPERPEVPEAKMLRPSNPPPEAFPSRKMQGRPRLSVTKGEVVSWRRRGL